MTAELLYHVNGDLVPATEATVSVDDRGFRYGDGVFETLRAYGGTIFQWEAHADRLTRSCNALTLEHGLTRRDLRSRIDETLVANSLEDAYVRLSITRGVQPGKLTPQPTVDPTVVIYVSELPRGGLEGTPVWERPATAELVETRRIPAEALPAGVKTHNYLNGIIARTELSAATDEALCCDLSGALAEGATSNLFFVRDGAVCTPTTDGPVLPGVTRAVILECAREAGIPVREERFEPAALFEAEEAFLSNTTWEIRPLERVDDVPIGSGPITEALQEAFLRRVERVCYQG